MLLLSHTLSTRTIRRGDQFGIYVDVKNGFTDGDICIKYVELTAPMGFIQLEEPITSELERSDLKSKAPIDDNPNGKSKAGKGKALSPLPLHFGAATNETVQSTCSQRYEYKLQAGGTYGSDPKPDTHIVSFKVFYTHQGRCYQDASNIEISIFPALTGMLFGTLLGSFIGTMATVFGSNTHLHFDIPALIARLVLNLILAFIAGIVLMRRKDVQSFITIEDFWGGILVGFVIAYAGTQVLNQFLGVPFPGSSGTPANRTLATVTNHNLG